MKERLRKSIPGPLTALSLLGFGLMLVANLAIADAQRDGDLLDMIHGAALLVCGFIVCSVVVLIGAIQRVSAFVLAVTLTDEEGPEDGDLRTLGSLNEHDSGRAVWVRPEGLAWTRGVLEGVEESHDPIMGTRLVRVRLKDHEDRLLPPHTPVVVS